MEREKFLGVSFVKDEKKDVAIKVGDDENKSMPIKEMRKSILKTAAEEDIELSDYKFQKFLNDKGMFKESREARNVNLHDIKVKNKQVINEVRFASGSMLEGFLAFYGIQLDKSLEKYESRLHVIEGEKGAYIGKVNRDGELTRVSPDMEKHHAINRLKEFELHRKQEKQELEHDFRIQIERKKEE